MPASSLGALSARHWRTGLISCQQDLSNSWAAWGQADGLAEAGRKSLKSFSHLQRLKQQFPLGGRTWCSWRSTWSPGVQGQSLCPQPFLWLLRARARANQFQGWQFTPATLLPVLIKDHQGQDNGLESREYAGNSAPSASASGSNHNS